MWRIWVPLKYLAIRHSGKWKFELLLPIILCAIFSSPLIVAEFRNEALSKFDLLGKTTSLIGTLAGFYVAALAAVATFGRPEMDETMQGPVTLTHARGAVTHVEDLTRRRFLSFLFGYLAFTSLVLGLIGAMYILIDKYALSAVADWRTTVFTGFWIVYTFIAGNILSNSLLGLFYLTDRMHRPNPGVQWTTPPPKPEPAE